MKTIKIINVIVTVAMTGFFTWTVFTAISILRLNGVL